jgi:RNA polymerase sigma-70 factor, ECF subfamily
VLAIAYRANRRLEVITTFAQRSNVQLAEASISDEFLLACVRDGDRDALGRLFRKHARAVRNVAYRILHSEAEADDLVQEVFLYIFRKAALFSPTQGRAATWILQIVAS